MCIECKSCGHVNSANRIYCYECSSRIQWGTWKIKPTKGKQRK